jgi:hypothetical protein
MAASCHELIAANILMIRRGDYRLYFPVYHSEERSQFGTQSWCQAAGISEKSSVIIRSCSKRNKRSGTERHLFRSGGFEEFFFKW